MTNGVWTYDIETISNLFTYTAQNRETKEVVQFVIWGDVNQLPELLEHLESCGGGIGFNNLGFDYPVIHFIMNEGYNWDHLSGDQIAKLIYKCAQETIKDQWPNVKDKFIKVPQLDLFKIWHYDNKARMTSLKKLQIALRYPNVQDMPYQHTDTIETYEQVQEILDYNLNDVLSTYDFYTKTLEKIELRKGLYNKYGLRCMNFSDSKIGEELTLKLYCEATGRKESEVRKLRTPRKVFKFKEILPWFLDFKTPEFLELQKYLEGIVVTELKGSFKYSFEHEGFTFDLGTGGIHGCTRAGVYESKDGWIIVDIDVNSLYPSLAIALGIFPAHLGKEFVTVYEDGIVKPRLKAKAEGDKVMTNGFKLSANSVYGKSNSEFSWLYDPLYTIKTTIAGQLGLCMLSERVKLAIPELKMLQINTDGITVMIPESKKRLFYNTCQAWEEHTHLGLEYVAYDKMIIRDVNNYASKSAKGKIKRKGAFVTYAQMLEEETYHKALNQPIVAYALEKFYFENVPVEETVTSCTNLYDFGKQANISKGWIAETHDEDGGNRVLQQKNNRYFVSTDGQLFTKSTPEKSELIEAGGRKVTVFNKFVEKPFDEYNIDYDYYIAECYKIIHVIDGTAERIENERRAAREAEKAAKAEEKYLKFCINKIPTQRQFDDCKQDWLIEKYGRPAVIKPSPVRKPKIEL
jgi:hypothetical protein